MTADPCDPQSYADGTPWHYAERKGGRVFTIMSDLVHPDTGETIITPDHIDAVSRRKGVTRSAWIVHDRDEYTADDVQQNPRATLGSVKPTHFHAVEERKSYTTVGQLARAYGLPPNFVRVVKGRGAFEDCCEYLTHEHPEQRAGKHLYRDDEVHAYGFAFRETIDANREARESGARGKKKLTDVDLLVQRIQTEGLTLRQAREQEPVTFSKSYTRMEKARDYYLRDAPMPETRTNYYFGGAARTGKSALARLFAEALARSLYPDLTADEAVFTVGRPSVAFQQYEGQPILVWDDYRPWSLIEALGGSRDSLWPALDVHPQRVQVNKKHGSVTLLNAVNIITGVVPYRDFLDNLAGEYTDSRGEFHASEDRNQAYGRFPFVSEVTADLIRFYINQGLADGTWALDSYRAIIDMQASMRSVMASLDAVPPAELPAVRAALGDRMLTGMVQAHLDFAASAAPTLPVADTVDAIMAEITITEGDDLLDSTSPADRYLDALDRIAMQLLDIASQLTDLDRVDRDSWSSRDRDRGNGLTRRRGRLLDEWRAIFDTAAGDLGIDGLVAALAAHPVIDIDTVGDTTRTALPGALTERADYWDYVTRRRGLIARGALPPDPPVRPTVWRYRSPHLPPVPPTFGFTEISYADA